MNFHFFHHFWAIFFPFLGHGPFSIFRSIVSQVRHILHSIPGGLTCNTLCSVQTRCVEGKGIYKGCRVRIGDVIVNSKVFSYQGRKKGVIAKGVFSLEDSLESLENGRILLCFPQSGGSLESLNSLKSLEMDFSGRTPFPKDPFFRTQS